MSGHVSVHCWSVRPVEVSHRSPLCVLHRQHSLPGSPRPNPLTASPWPPPAQTYFPERGDFSSHIDLYRLGLVILQLLGSLPDEKLACGKHLGEAKLEDIPNVAEWPECIRDVCPIPGAKACHEY